MNPEHDQQQWLARARELAADVQRGFHALQPDHGALAAALLLSHMKTLMRTPDWHEKTLDTFLKDMLPLADCFASLEARLPDDRKGNEQLATKRFLLAGEGNAICQQLLATLLRRFQSGITTPPPDITQRLVLSASLAVRGVPKALRAKAERELGQAEHPTALAPMLGLLSLAGYNVAATLTVMGLQNYEGPHTKVLRATLFAPATLASTLGDLAAVYARCARFPATFKEQEREWLDLSMLASNLLDLPENAAVRSAVEESADTREQLAAALLPYAAHLLKVADVRGESWLDAWGELVPALAAEAVWPNPEAAAAGGAAQYSAAVQGGLLRLLRALPPPGKPPQSYRNVREWVPLPLYSAKAASVAATKALKIGERVPELQVQLVPALRGVQQRGLATFLALLPITVDLLAAAAEQLEGSGAGDGTGLDRALYAYDGCLVALLALHTQAARQLCIMRKGGQMLGVQPGGLAAAAEAALRLVSQAAALVQPLRSVDHGELERPLHIAGLALVEATLELLPPAAKQEVTGAPEPGGVRPSLQAQLQFVHTACKFARVVLAPGAGGAGAPTDEMQAFVCPLVDQSSLLLTSHVRAADIPQKRAPLTPAEKRALIGSALAQAAASSALVQLLPEGSLRDAQRRANAFHLCRILAEPDLAGALLAQHAQLAEKLMAGLDAAVRIATTQEAVEILGSLSNNLRDAMEANRCLVPMILGGAAGEALEAGLRQSLQSSGPLAQFGRGSWVYLLATLTVGAEQFFNDWGEQVAALLGELAKQKDPLEGGRLQALRAVADEWLAQEPQPQPQWRQEQLLLCAEAAATRACSNLACTNMSGGSESGLKARQCSGCRCVRYCSTACQRADWAAGHKAVCKWLQAGRAEGR